MEDFLLLVVVLVFAGIGYHLMKKIDLFLEENEKKREEL